MHGTVKYGLRLLVAFLGMCICANELAARAPDGSRQFKLVNQCAFPVWLGFAGGGSTTPSGGQCQTSNDCYPGSSCVQTGPIRQCFWNNPKPADGKFELAAQGGTTTVTIPHYNAGSSVVWSGIVSARLGCANGKCDTADCGDDGAGGCSPSHGFGQPATQAEFTLSATGIDFYDVEIINGVTVPIEMAPVVTSQLRDKMRRTASPYFCGSPGAPVASSPLLGGCSWSFNPPSNDYRWVAAGGKSCAADADCDSGTQCGLSTNPGHTPNLQKTCGLTVGWWTADQVCGIDPTYGAPFNCQQAAGNGQTGPVTLSNLYGCTNVGSCYQNGATPECCGCVNWDQAGVQVPGAQYTQQCSNVNPTWVSEVQPKLQWLKEGCPTAYTYPYDDMSSTFTCSNVQSGVNTVDYVITYCPTSSTPTPSTPTTPTTPSSPTTPTTPAPPTTPTTPTTPGTPTTPATPTYAYVVYVAAHSPAVTINGNTPCASGSACRVTQNIGAAITVAGSRGKADLCYFTVEQDGTLQVGPASAPICHSAYLGAAGTATAGTIALPAGF